jgi:hypothetical protein
MEDADGARVSRKAVHAALTRAAMEPDMHGVRRGEAAGERAVVGLHLCSSRGNREAGRVEPMEEQGVAPWLESACSKGARPFAAMAGGVHGGWPSRGVGHGNCWQP